MVDIWQYSDMKCPYCRFESTDVVNSRATRNNTQTWRRRKCLGCSAIFTTYEQPNLSFIMVRKKSGQNERYSRAKLFAGMYGATLSIPNKELVVEELTCEVEDRLLDLRQKEVTTEQIATAVLQVLHERNTAAFARYLAYQADITSSAQLLREIKKYTS